MKVIATCEDWLMLTADDVDAHDENFIFEKCTIIKVKDRIIIDSKLPIGSWFNHVPYWTEPTREYTASEINEMLETFEKQD